MVKKLTTTLFFLFFTLCINAQDISCSELLDIVTSKYDSKKTAHCYTSTMLIKVNYYKLDGHGFVVAYIKKNDYDFRGTPYVFCGITNSKWNSFTFDATYGGSWGKSFHKNIIDNTCNCY